MQIAIPQPSIKGIKQILTDRGYYITPDYGLIKENPTSEYALGAVRKRSFLSYRPKKLYHPEKVVFSFSIPEDEAMKSQIELEAGKLLKILNEECILYVNLDRNAGS